MTSFNIQKYYTIKAFNQAIESVRLHHFQHIGQVIDFEFLEIYTYCQSRPDIPMEWVDFWRENFYENNFIQQLQSLELSLVPFKDSPTEVYIRPTEYNIGHLYRFEEYQQADLNRRRVMIFEEFLIYTTLLQLHPERDVKDGLIQSLTELELFMKESNFSWEETLEEFGLKMLLDREVDIEFKEFCDHNLSPLNQMYQEFLTFKEHQIESFNTFVEHLKKTN